MAHQDTYSEDNNSAWHAAEWQRRKQAEQWIYIRVQKSTITTYEDPDTLEQWSNHTVQRWSYYYDLGWNYPAIFYYDNFLGALVLKVANNFGPIRGNRCISSGTGVVENDEFSNNVESLMFVFENGIESAPTEVWKNGDKIFRRHEDGPTANYYHYVEEYIIFLEHDGDDPFMGGYFTEIATANAWALDGEDKLYCTALPEKLVGDNNRLPWQWYLDSYSQLMNDLIPLRLYDDPVMEPAERPEPIGIYDVHEPQNGFDHNGVAVLMPYEVTSNKEDKGRWDITAKHPIDQYGKWTYIAGQNIIKVRKQLFRIDETEIVAEAAKEYIAFHANHISYDLKDFWIQDAEFSVESGYDYIGELWSHRVKDFPNQQAMIGDYEYRVTSDLIGHIDAKVKDQSYIEALYGSDSSMASRYGGELYRDNFYMSINQTMEGAPAGNAFAIRYGTNMTKISFKIDMSNWITNLVCVDNLGNLYACWYDTAGGEWICHHHKTKRIHFTYDDFGDSSKNMQRLIADGDAYWDTVATPQISIEVGVANIYDDPRYADFVNLQNFDVGYRGIIYVEHLGINIEMKITAIKRNELTGQAISIKLGSVRGSLIRQTVMSQTIVDPNSVEGKNTINNAQLQQELEDVYMKIMSSSISSMMTFTINQLEEHTIDELEGN